MRIIQNDSPKDLGLTSRHRALVEIVFSSIKVLLDRLDYRRNDFQHILLEQAVLKFFDVFLALLKNRILIVTVSLWYTLVFLFNRPG